MLHVARKCPDLNRSSRPPVANLKSTICPILFLFFCTQIITRLYSCLIHEQRQFLSVTVLLSSATPSDAIAVLTCERINYDDDDDDDDVCLWFGDRVQHVPRLSNGEKDIQLLPCCCHVRVKQ